MAVAAVSRFWSGLIWVFFCPLLWSRLIGDIWVFVPVGFWWLIWVDQRLRKHWSSGGGVWVLIGVDLGFFFFFCCDRFFFVWVLIGGVWVAVIGVWFFAVIEVDLGCGWNGLLVIGDRQCLGPTRSWQDRRGSRWWVWWRSAWVTAWLAGSSRFYLSDRFFFFFFLLIWVFFRRDFGGQWAMVTRWAWWRHGGGDWAVEEKIGKIEKIYFIT